MNKLALLFFVLFYLTGCTKAVIKPFDRISGEWICQTFAYHTIDGKLVNTDTVDFYLRFENCNSKQEENAKRCPGMLYSDEKKYDFEYLASLAAGDKDFLNITVDSAILSYETYPVEFIGLANVYTVRYNGKNKMELSTDVQESYYNFLTGESITKLKWTFIKQ